MSSSIFSDDESERNKNEKTLIIIVNNDTGNISVDPALLQNIIESQRNTAVSIVSIDNRAGNGSHAGNSDGSVPRVNVTLDQKGFYSEPFKHELNSQPTIRSTSRGNSNAASSTPASSASYAATSSTSSVPDETNEAIESFVNFDLEQIKNLEQALKSDKAKEILGQNVANILGENSSSSQNDHAASSTPMSQQADSFPPGIEAQSKSNLEMADDDPIFKEMKAVFRDHSYITPTSSRAPSESGRTADFDDDIHENRTDLTANDVSSLLISPARLTSGDRSKLAGENPVVAAMGQQVQEKVRVEQISFDGGNDMSSVVTENELGKLNIKLNESDTGDEGASSFTIDLIGEHQRLQNKDDGMFSKGSYDDDGDYDSVPLAHLSFRQDSISDSTADDISDWKSRKNMLNKETVKRLSTENNGSDADISDSAETTMSVNEHKKKYPRRERRVMSSISDTAHDVTATPPNKDNRGGALSRVEPSSERGSASGVSSSPVLDTKTDRSRGRRSAAALTPEAQKALKQKQNEESARNQKGKATKGAGASGGKLKEAEQKGKAKGKRPTAAEQEEDSSAVDSQEEETEADEGSQGEADDDDDPNKLWCICRKPHNNRFMICCDKCNDWFHGNCVGVTQAMGKQIEDKKIEWYCRACRAAVKTQKAAKADAGKKDKGGSGATPTSDLRKESRQSAGSSGRRNEAKSGSAAKSRESLDSVNSKSARLDSGRGQDESNAKDKRHSRDAVTKEREPRVEERRKSDLPKSPPLMASSTKSSTASTTVAENNASKAEVSPKCKPTAICIVCKKDAKPGSIYCSNDCIAKHAEEAVGTPANESAAKQAKSPISFGAALGKITSAQLAGAKSQASRHSSGPDERVSVFERTSGRLLTGECAPLSSELKLWLQGHPTFEVLKPASPSSTFYSKPILKKQQIQTTNVKTHGISAAASRSLLQKSTVVSSAEDSSSKSLIKSKFKDSSPVAATPSKAIEMIGGSKMPSSRHRSSSGQSHQGGQKMKSPPHHHSESKNSKDNDEKQPAKKGDAKKDDLPLVSQAENEANVRASVKKGLKDALIKRCSDSSSGSLPVDAIESLSCEIEEELFSVFKDTGTKYKAKYRSLMFNLRDPKNNIYLRILNGIISPVNLIKMSPEEMASQELAEWREREMKHQLDVIQKTELDRNAVGNTYMVKTHKGEEVVERDDSLKPIGPNETSASTDTVVDFIPSDLLKDTTLEHLEHFYDIHCDICSGKKKVEEVFDPKKLVKKDRMSLIENQRMKEKEKGEYKHQKEREKERRKKDSNRESSKEEKGGTSGERAKEALKDVKMKTEAKEISDDNRYEEDRKGAVDLEVGSDREPSSTVQAVDTGAIYQQQVSRAPSVWKGFINMPDVNKFVTTAHGILGVTDHLSKDLLDCLEVVGRIAPETVWDYVGKMRRTGTKDIIVIRFEPANEEETFAYSAFYEHLSTRGRFGVVGKQQKSVKDFYIVPFSKMLKIPDILLPSEKRILEDLNPSSLLLGLIICLKKKKERPDTATSSPQKVKVHVKHNRSQHNGKLTERHHHREHASSHYGEMSASLADRIVKRKLEPSEVSRGEASPYGGAKGFGRAGGGRVSPDDDKEPYSPTDDSDLETISPKSLIKKQKQMLEELNRKIELQKRQLKSMGETIGATYDGTQSMQSSSSLKTFAGGFYKSTKEASDTTEAQDAYSPSHSLGSSKSDSPEIKPMSITESSEVSLPQSLNDILAKIKQTEDEMHRIQQQKATVEISVTSTHQEERANVDTRLRDPRRKAQVSTSRDTSSMVSSTSMLPSLPNLPPLPPQPPPQLPPLPPTTTHDSCPPPPRISRDPRHVDSTNSPYDPFESEEEEQPYSPTQAPGDELKPDSSHQQQKEQYLEDPGGLGYRRKLSPNPASQDMEQSYSPSQMYEEEEGVVGSVVTEEQPYSPSGDLDDMPRQPHPERVTKIPLLDTSSGSLDPKYLYSDDDSSDNSGSKRSLGPSGQKKQSVPEPALAARAAQGRKRKSSTSSDIERKVYDDIIYKWDSKKPRTVIDLD